MCALSHLYPCVSPCAHVCRLGKDAFEQDAAALRAAEEADALEAMAASYQNKLAEAMLKAKQFEG